MPLTGAHYLGTQFAPEPNTDAALPLLLLRGSLVTYSTKGGKRIGDQSFTKVLLRICVFLVALRLCGMGHALMTSVFRQRLIGHWTKH